MTIKFNELPDWLKLEPVRYRSLVIQYTHSLSMIRIVDKWRKERRTLTFSTEGLSYDSYLDHARQYLHTIGIEVVGITNTGTDCYNTFLTTDFSTSIKGIRGWKKKAKIKPPPRKKQ